MIEIQSLKGLEILDSRGRPTLQVNCELASGARASAQVPSGASTGAAEAVELRDGDAKRHGGRGCLRAVKSVAEIAAALRGRQLGDQAELDATLAGLDGTANKSRLGANALLGVSLTVARAMAVERRCPLHRHLARCAAEDSGTCQQLPVLTVNLFSGGKHAGGQVAIQDVLLVPRSASTVQESLEMVSAVYTAAAQLCQDQYGMRLLTADEGGLAPPFPSVTAMLDNAVTAIRMAGLIPSTDIALAVDIAASHFFVDGYYQVDSQPLDSVAMVERVSQWVGDYPIISVEDGLAEDDWEHWPQLTEALAGRARVVGDDLLCTNPDRIERAAAVSACDTLLLKVNQIGTLTEAAAALRSARVAGWQVIASARSGETEDHWLADLAVGWNADYIKVGSVTQSDRLSKYNRLLAIEAGLD